MRWSNVTPDNCHFTIAGADALPAGSDATQFAFSQMSTYSDIQNLFDNIRMVKVLYRWVINRTPDWASTTTNRGYPVRITWRHDFNDGNPITRTQMMQGNMRELYLGVDKPYSRWYTLKPALLLQGYESATSTAYSPKWMQWLDTNDSTAPHYGLKFNWSELYTGVALRLEAKIVVQCKGIS